MSHGVVVLLRVYSQVTLYKAVRSMDIKSIYILTRSKHARINLVKHTKVVKQDQLPSPATTPSTLPALDDKDSKKGSRKSKLEFKGVV